MLSDHEAARWERETQRFHSLFEASSSAQREQAVVALALLGAADTGAAAQLLRRVPELRDVPEGLIRQLCRWVGHLYPTVPGELSGVEVEIRPHLLGDWLLVDRLAADQELARALLADPTPEQRQRALRMLVRAAEAVPEAVPLLSQLVVSAFPVLLQSAIDLIRATGPGNARLDAAAAGWVAYDTLPADVIETLDNRLPEWALPRTRLAVGHLMVDLARPQSNQPDLAAALGNLGNRLGALGRHDEALDATTEAVSLCRRLAADDPDRHQPNLAAALNNLGNRLGALGRHREALDATTQAVDLRRRLAADNPDRHQPNLAAALNNLGIDLGALGRHHEALDATTQAVDLHRRLAADNPDRHQPDLAAALDNLAIDLHHVGQHDEELLVAREALDEWRQLARREPSLHKDTYAARLAQLRQRLETHGLTPDALTLGLAEDRQLDN